MVILNRKTPSSYVRQLLAFGLVLSCACVLPVCSQRDSIRGSYQRQRDRESDRIGSYSNSRPNRGSNPTTPPAIPSNNNGGSSNNSNKNEPNLVLVTQCDPNNPGSYYNTFQTAKDDGVTDCDQYLSYCERKYSGLVFTSFSSFVYPRDFYEAVESLYDKCFKTCAEHLGGGPDAFCVLPEPSRKYASLLSKESMDYCSVVADDSKGGVWTAAMRIHEAEVETALNARRDRPSGTICNRRISGSEMASAFFPRSSPVVVNPELSCAARIQAQNIVVETLEQNGRFPSNLHNACPNSLSQVIPPNLSATPICEKFSTRMVSAGYPYDTEGFGYIHEVTAVGYGTAEAVVDGWLASTSGHCSAIAKQESPVIATEVGIGYYEYGGITGHVVVVGQRRS
mmetsp:Transcript_30245/g.71260  ORF Transcript_30245/g.71260 Transcript_30245/m.71260 type:complete len:396 (+) Transcript_30245:152-1339(+)